MGSPLSAGADAEGEGRQKVNPAPLPNGDQFLLQPEVAAILRCSVATVRRLIQECKIPCGKIRGRIVVFKSRLSAYINNVTASMQEG